MKVLPLFILLFSTFASAAAYTPPALPAGCYLQNSDYQNGELLLGGNKKGSMQRIFFLQNQSANTLWLNHPIADPGASAGWMTQLAPQKWSAIAVDQGDFALNCVEARPGSQQYIPCQDVLAVCEFQNAQWEQDKAPGTIWLAENVEYVALLDSLRRRGFVVTP